MKNYQQNTNKDKQQVTGQMSILFCTKTCVSILWFISSQHMFSLLMVCRDTAEKKQPGNHLLVESISTIFNIDLSIQRPPEFTVSIVRLQGKWRIDFCI